MINLSINKNQFNEKYLPQINDSSKRYEVYYGGAGSGKSVFVAQKIIYRACKEVCKILVIRKYATTIKDSVFDLVLSILKKWKIYQYCKVNLTTYTITLPNNSVILFKGLDDPEKIKSINGLNSIIWCEEATELTEEEFTQLDLRLRDGENLQLISTFNPVSKANWVYKKWFAPEAINENTFILKTTYKDNRFLPTEYIESLKEKERTNPTYYRIYALGEFCSLDKLVYTNWNIGSPINTEGMKLAVGLDFGFVNDLTALTVSLIDTDKKEIYITDCWGDTGKTNSEIAQIIKNKGYSKSLIIADSAEPKSIEELKRAGIYRIRASVKGPDSIIHGINLLQQYHIFVDIKCEGVITELQNYAWKKDKKTNEYINEPVDEFNHYLDALRYSLQCIDNHKLQSMDKKILSL